MGRSITNELLDKSKEAMVSAVQIYNNPLIKFKSEMFIILPLFLGHILCMLIIARKV